MSQLATVPMGTVDEAPIIVEESQEAEPSDTLLELFEKALEGEKRREKEEEMRREAMEEAKKWRLEQIDEKRKKREEEMKKEAAEMSESQFFHKHVDY